jgi:hypothetical protein
VDRRPITRAVFGDDIATCLPLMRARYALAVRASQRRQEAPVRPRSGGITYSDAFTVTPRQLIALS